MSSSSSYSTYRCIHCLTPCDSLYRKYGSSTIKLSQCSNCQRDVDPYCEREWLLVVLDCILLREEAYRHVLFHRRVELDDYLQSLLLLASVLRAKFVWEACHRQTTAVFHYFGFLQRVLESGLLLLLTVGILYGLLFLQSKGTKAAKDGYNAAISSSTLVKLVYLAVLLPTVVCHAATLGVQIWETSDTVRQLGSLLALMYQWMGLVTVSNSKPWATLALAVTLGMRALIVGTTPCPGLEWNTGASSFCFA
jgi:succinate dehydrogenase/fumarate reductase cytochrome b subunit